MKKYQKKITVYELGDGFIVEVHKDKEVTEFYVQHKDYFIKMGMIGICDCDAETEKQIIEENAADYIEIYKEEYC